MTEEYRNWESFSHSGMVLEGGGSRGVFTAGVLDYFMEKNLYLPYTVGVSAGACNALDYASGQMGRTKDVFIVNDKKRRGWSMEHFFKTHYLYDMDMLFDEYPNRLIPFDHESYKKRGMRVEMVVTNLTTGRPEYLSDYKSSKRLYKICRASCSLPMVAPPVKMGADLYMDGGLADSIPYGHSLMLGNTKNVVILTREMGYRKKLKSGMEGIFRRMYKDHPALVRAIINRPKVYNRQLDILERLEREGKVFVIRPTEKPVGRAETDPHKLEAFYEHGYNTGVAVYEEVLEYLRA